MNNHTNEIRTMNNGQKAEIIEYRNCYDIDIRFEDSTVVLHKDYSNFKKGAIKNPNRKGIQNTENRIKNRVNEKKMMNNGMYATIIAYRNNKDIDVKFEDNTIVSHRQYSRFKTGNIRNPNI